MQLLGKMLLIMVMILNASPVLAQDDKKTLTLAVEPTWPPLEFIGTDGQIAGYAVDYFTAVCRESGLEAKFIKVDWDVLEDGLAAGKYDAIMASLTITPKRRQTMDFTIPYYIVRQSLVVPQGSSLKDLRQLQDKKTGTQAETTATGIVEKIPGVVSVTFPSIEDAVAALAKGELDAVVCEDVVATDFLSRYEFAGKLKIASVINTPGAEELYAVAVRKGNLKVLVPLNDGIKAVKEKGLEAELRRKWFPETSR